MVFPLAMVGCAVIGDRASILEAALVTTVSGTDGITQRSR
jgi:hypothetical protein